MKRDDYYQKLVNTIIDGQSDKHLQPANSSQAALYPTPTRPFLEAISPTKARWSMPSIEELK